MGKLKKISDKRKYPRLEMYFLAKYRLFSQPQSQQGIITSLKNISGGGVCLYTKEYLSPASLIHLYINFPHFSQTVISLAKVVWIKERKKIKQYEVGLEFVEVDEFLREEIIKSIDFTKRLTQKKVGRKINILR